MSKPTKSKPITGELDRRKGAKMAFKGKRWTDPRKWDNEWFQELESRHKFLWLYLLDRCDGAGVWRPNWRLAAFQIGEPVEEADMDALGRRVQRLENGKWWIVDYIDFQQGGKPLSAASNFHQPIIESINENNIPYPPPPPPTNPLENEKPRVAKPLPKGCPRVQVEVEVDGRGFLDGKGGVGGKPDAQADDGDAAYKILSSCSKLSGLTFDQDMAVRGQIAETLEFDIENIDWEQVARIVADEAILENDIKIPARWLRVCAESEAKRIIHARALAELKGIQKSIKDKHLDPESTFHELEKATQNYERDLPKWLNDYIPTDRKNRTRGRTQESEKEASDRFESALRKYREMAL